MTIDQWKSYYPYAIFEEKEDVIYVRDKSMISVFEFVIGKHLLPQYGFDEGGSILHNPYGPALVYEGGPGLYFLEGKEVTYETWLNKRFYYQFSQILQD